MRTSSASPTITTRCPDKIRPPIASLAAGRPAASGPRLLAGLKIDLLYPSRNCAWIEGVLGLSILSCHSGRGGNREPQHLSSSPQRESRAPTPVFLAAAGIQSPSPRLSRRSGNPEPRLCANKVLATKTRGGWTAVPTQASTPAQPSIQKMGRGFPPRRKPRGRNRANIPKFVA